MSDINDINLISHVYHVCICNLNCFYQIHNICADVGRLYLTYLIIYEY